MATIFGCCRLAAASASRKNRSTSSGLARVPARIFDLPLPPLPRGAFYLWILATLLSMLAMLYLAAAYDPRRYSAIIAVAIGGRTLGALALAAAALAGQDLRGLFPLAAADLAFGAVHAIAWLPIRS